MLAENLKALRKAKGLSQEELAARLHVVRQTVSQPRTVSCRSSNSITVTNPFSCQGSICPILCPGIGRYVLNMEKFSQQARQRLGGMDHHHFHSVPLLSGHEKHPSAPSLCREGTGGAFGWGQDFPQDWLALARSYSRT